MKKAIARVLLVLMVMGALTGCAPKTECDFCGEEKRCKTESVLGQEIHYCKDCEDAITGIFK